MKMILKIFSLLMFVSLFTVGIGGASATTPGNNTTIIKELPLKPELDNFIDGVEHTAHFTNTATQAAIEQHPTWPHDVWTDPDGNRYVSFYYKENSSPGYTSVYYDDCGRELGSVCKISFTLIDPYYGLNVTENRNTERIILPNVSTQPNESTTTQVLSVTNETVTQVAENNTMYPVSNQGTGIQANDTNIKIDDSQNNGTITQQIGNIYNNFMINVQNLKVYFEGK